MRKIKKTLAVALVLVFALGVMPLASAAPAPTFPDDDAIKYKEAVDVLSALNIVEGMPDGNFAPAQNVTRAEAATIIARMIMKRSVADIMPQTATPFSDVPASHWASGAVSFCAAQGFILGYPNGNFGPNDPVTGAQFAVMMMRAIGVGNPARWSGTSWQTFAIIDGMDYGILDTGVDYTAAASRDQTAKYAFNGLTRGNTVTEAQTWFFVTAIANGGPYPAGFIGGEYPSRAAVMEAGGDRVMGEHYNITPFTKNVDVTKDSIANKTYKLVSTKAPDAFGRPDVRTWKDDKGNTIATTNLASPEFTYTAGVTEAKVFADLGLGETSTATRFINGVKVIGTTLRHNFTGSNDANSATFGTGRGALTEVYRDGKDITVVIIQTFYGTINKVNAATAVAKASVDIETVDPGPGGATETSLLNREATGFAKDDRVLYTASSVDGINWTARSVALAKSETVTASQYTTSNFVADGVTYQYSQQRHGAAIANFGANEVFFDNYGYVIFVKAPSAVTNYAYVVRVGESGDGWGGSTLRAELVLGSTGEKVQVTLAAAYSIGGANDPARLVTYEVKDSKYTLKPTGATGRSGTFKVSQGNPIINWDINLTANSKTVYFVRTGSADDSTYTVYTDFRDVPSMQSVMNDEGVNSVSGIVAVDGGVVTALYVEFPRVGASTSELIFLSKKPDSQTTMSDGTTYWRTTNVMRNGEMIEDGLSLRTNYDVGLYKMSTTNAAGITTLEDKVPTFVDTVIRYNNGVLTIGSASYVPSADINVYTWNADGEITTGTISTIPTAADVERTVIVTFDSSAGHIVTNIFLLAT